MMLIWRYCLTFFAVNIICTSCGQKLSEIKEYNQDGSLYQEYSIDKDSILQGPLTSYFEDGTTIFENAYYVNGQLHGTRSLHYDNGIPEIVEKYQNDILIDTVHVFFKSGRIKRKAPYVNGVLTGLVTSYYENGHIKEEANFSNNIENGAFSEYHPNGIIKWSGQFLNGDNEFGELQEFDSSGLLIRKMLCDSLAICRTFWTLKEGDISSQ